MTQMGPGKNIQDQVESLVNKAENTEQQAPLDKLITDFENGDLKPRQVKDRASEFLEGVDKSNINEMRKAQSKLEIFMEKVGIKGDGKNDMVELRKKQIRKLNEMKAEFDAAVAKEEEALLQTESDTKTQMDEELSNIANQPVTLQENISDDTDENAPIKLEEIAVDEEEEEAVDIPEEIQAETKKIVKNREMELELTDGLRQLRENGKKFMADAANQALFKKLGVTVSDKNYGDRGGWETIHDLQQKLIVKTFSVGPTGPDGILGTNTETAIANYRDSLATTRDSQIIENDSNAKAVQNAETKDPTLSAQTEGSVDTPKTKEQVLTDHPEWEDIGKDGNNWKLQIQNLADLPNKEDFPNGGEACFSFAKGNTEYRFYGNDRVMVTDTTTKKFVMKNKADVISSLSKQISQEDAEASNKQKESAQNIVDVPGEIFKMDADSIKSVKRDFFMGTDPDSGKKMYQYSVIGSSGAEKQILISEGNKIVTNRHYSDENLVLEDNVLSLSPKIREKQKKQAKVTEELGLDSEDWDDIKGVEKNDLIQGIKDVLEYKKKYDLKTFGAFLNDIFAGTLPKPLRNIGSSDFNTLEDWMSSDKGRAFVGSDAKNLDEYFDTLS